MGRTVLAGNFGKTSAPLELWARAIANVATHAQASGIHVAFPRLVAGLFGEAMAAGYGREEVSAPYKALRRPGPVA